MPLGDASPRAIGSSLGTHSSSTAESRGGPAQWAAVLTAPGLVAVTARRRPALWPTRIRAGGHGRVGRHDDGSPAPIDGVRWHESGDSRAGHPPSSGFRRWLAVGRSSTPQHGRRSREWRVRCSRHRATRSRSCDSLRRELAAARRVRHGGILLSIWPISRVARTPSPRSTSSAGAKGRPTAADSTVLPAGRSWSTSLSRRRLRNLLRRGRWRHPPASHELLG